MNHSSEKSANSNCSRLSLSTIGTLLSKVEANGVHSTGNVTPILSVKDPCLRHLSQVVPFLTGQFLVCISGRRP